MQLQNHDQKNCTKKLPALPKQIAENSTVFNNTRISCD